MPQGVPVLEVYTIRGGGLTYFWGVENFRAWYSFGLRDLSHMFFSSLKTTHIFGGSKQTFCFRFALKSVLGDQKNFHLNFFQLRA